MVLHNLMATSLFLMSLLILLLDSNPCTALSWRNNSLMDDIGTPCPISPHPFTMCKSEAEAYGYPCEDHKVLELLWMYSLTSFSHSNLCFRDKMRPSCEVCSLNLWQVTTEDGYILSLKRIPHGHDTDNSTGDEKTRQPILLFHGLFVVRALLEKFWASEIYALLNRMSGFVRMAFLGYWVHQTNHLALFWQTVGLMFG